MATVGLYRVILGQAIGAPWDPAVNDFVIEDSGSLVGASVAGVMTALHNFYSTTPAGGTNPLRSYMTDLYVSGTPTVEVYDITGHLDGSPHGSPVIITSFTAPGGNANQCLPANLSVGLELRSDYGDALEFGAADATIPSSDEAIDEGAPATHAGRDRPRARHRGRILLGPLNVTALSVTTTNPAGVHGSLSADLVLAAKALQAEVSALIPGVTQWSQWSRRDSQVRRIKHAECRQTFSTSRRRQDLGPFTSFVDFA